MIEFKSILHDLVYNCNLSSSDCISENCSKDILSKITFLEDAMG